MPHLRSFPLHPRSVMLKKGNPIKVHMNLGIINLVCLRLPHRVQCLMQAVELYVSVYQIRISVSCRTDSHRRLERAECLIVVAQLAVDDAQIGIRSVARVNLRQHFKDLARRYQIPGDDQFIMRGNVEPFPLGRAALSVQMHGGHSRSHGPSREG